MTKTIDPQSAVSPHACLRENGRSLNRLTPLAEATARNLAERHERLVLAESCTGGMISSILTQLPGISSLFCGSMVAYRPASKRRWIGVSRRTIKKNTTESHEVAREMALGVLRRTKEANWALAVVGHFGPEVPTEKDGVIHYCIARRTKKGRLKVRDDGHHKVEQECRHKQQELATEIVLTSLARALLQKSKRETNAGSNGKV